MTHLSLQTQLAQQITPDDALANSIFGTTDIDEISALLNDYCHQQLGYDILYCTFAYLSVGATFVVQLSDLRQVVLKAYGTQQSLSSLRASFQVQQALADSGFPCPAVLQLPQRVGSTILTAQAYCKGDHSDEKSLSGENSLPVQQRLSLEAMTHVRWTMAHSLARLIGQSKFYSHQDIPIWMELHNPRLWHRPHSILFDFEKTAAGAEWIDNIAQQAKQRLRAATGPMVIGHSDWSLQNMSFDRGDLACVYDWDSLRVGLEPCFVGGAARVYRHDWRVGPPEPAISLAEVQDFVREYEAAGGRPFTTEEHRVLGAAIVYTAAYGVRCAHAIRGSNDAHYENAKGQLRQFADYLLDGKEYYSLT